MNTTRSSLNVRAIAAQFPAHCPVDERHEPVARGTYERELLPAPRPVLLRRLAVAWPASRRWTFDYLAARGQGVEVVATRSLVETEKTVRETVELRAYIQSVLGGAAADGQNYVSYLPLFEALPELKADVPFAELYGSFLLKDLAAWIGPAGTVTGLHDDTLPNLVAQIRGRKGLLLFPPSPLDRIYRSAKFDFGTHLSLVDLCRPDFARFPRLRELRPLVAVLEEGDGLYIPPAWWHFVVAETPSVTLSLFAGSLRQALRRVLPQVPQLLLHRAGLYAQGNCVCHN